MKLIRDQRRTQTTNDTEAGTALVLFAVRVFAILGIAALTVDVAFARLCETAACRDSVWAAPVIAV